MANELTFIEQAERKVSTLSNERKCDRDANKLSRETSFTKGTLGWLIK